jgi:hypothetical protein
MNFITKNFFNLLILALIIFMLLRGCNTSEQSIQKKPDTITIVDTTYITKTNTKIKKVFIVSTDSSYNVTKDKKFVADTSYEVLKTQFTKLSKDYTAKNIYKDTLVFDSIVFVHITDSVQFNTLLNRSYKYSYNLPVITKTTTVTNYAKQVGQLYVGVGINSLGMNSINGGLMYKSKRDQLYGFTLGVNNNQLVYGVQTYFKIKLKK